MPFKKSFKSDTATSSDNEETQPKGKETLSERASNSRGSAMVKGFSKEKESTIVPSFNNAGGQHILRTGMTEKELGIRLFLLEEEPGFSTLSDREKFNIIARRSDHKIQEWYYELGTAGNLPENYETFKRLMINKCTEKGIMAIRKFKDEKWSSYIERLRCTVTQNDTTEKEILRKLRTTMAPRELQVVFYSTNTSIDEIIEIVKDWEILNNRRKNYQETGINIGKHQTKENKGVKCFKCGRVGHYSNNCRHNVGSDTGSKDSKINLANFGSPDVDKREVKINDLQYMSIFDTASTINVVSKRFCDELKIAQIDSLEIPKKVLVIDGREITMKESVYLNIEYNNYKTQASFYVLNNSVTDLLIGKALIDELEKARAFPFECRIPIYEQKIISWTRPVRSMRDKEEFQELVAELERRGIVERSHSLWLNPVVLTRKKSGALRFCVDLRKINDLVQLDSFELPLIQECIRTLHGKTHFSIIDLKDGYFQVPIHPADKEKTTFLDGKGRLMQFTKMPQGYKNAPAIFQRGMTTILGDLLHSKCIVYIDDILIYGESKADHDRNLQLVKEVLANYKLEINEKKSIVCQEEVEFLGYKIGRNEIKPLETRAEGILNYPIPTTKKQLRRFIGLMGYDRAFVKELSARIKPLYEIVSEEGKVINWNNKSMDCFNEIKSVWANKLRLRMPDPNKKYVLETDASDTGLGAVLKQEDQPIAYLSRLLKGAEKNYTITEREFLAAMWAMEKLEFYLIGKEFTLVTDHKALESIKTKATFGTPRIMRWLSRLERFNYKICYRQANNMEEPDMLSRNTQDGINLVLEDREERIIKIHKNLTHRKNIRNDLEKEGIKIPGKELKEILRTCQKCARNDKTYSKSAKFIQTFGPGEIISVDIMEINKKYRILMAIDYFSRKIWGICLNSKHANKIVDFLNHIKSEIEIKTLFSDNGKEFDNKYVANWAKTNNVKRELAIPYYHQHNGRIERCNRTIRNAIRKGEGPIKKRLAKAIEAYNKSFHRGIGMAPIEAMSRENRVKVLKYADKYSKEFKQRKIRQFDIGDQVYIRNETKANKMDEEYKMKGTIIHREGTNCYKVRNEKGKIIRRHGTQLKI